METLPLLEGVSRYEASDDVCAAKHGGDPMSEAAHENVRHTKTETQQRILDYLRANGPAACFEIAEALDIPYTSASARCSEIRRDGRAWPTGRTRKTPTGSWAAVLSASREVAE